MRKRNRLRKCSAMLCLMAGLAVSQTAGCGQASVKADDRNGKNQDELSKGSEEALQTSGNVTEQLRSEEVKENGEIVVTAVLGEEGRKQISYEPEDLETGWDQESAGKLILSDEGITAEGTGVAVSGSVAVIQKQGTYVVSGSMTDGQIRIEAKDGEIVRLVLNGAELWGKTTAPIYGEGKSKVVLTLAEGTQNVIGDSSTYQYEDSSQDEQDAPVFVNGDLTINGLGELEVYGNYKSGVRSKDNLKVMSGTIDIKAADDGLKGRDCVIIRDGELNIQAVQDGIKSNHDQDPEKGFVWIDGGRITIEAEDDGIQAETRLIVCGGQIDVRESQEGLAGKTVDILGGQIKAVTQDDGINSAASVDTETEKMQDQEGVYTRIAGGQVWLNARADGIDSNGDLYVEGGDLYVSGPVSRGDGILDYNGNARITGGIVFAAGTSGMMQTFGSDSVQNYLVVHWEEGKKAGDVIRLTDQKGEVLGEYAPEKDFDAAIISVPGLESGSVYQVQTESSQGENETVEIEVAGVETVYGTSAGRMGGHGGRRSSEDGLWEGDEPPKPPEGMQDFREREMPEDGEPFQSPEGRRDFRGKGMPEEGEAPKSPEGMKGGRGEEMPEEGEASKQLEDGKDFRAESVPEKDGT